MKQTNTRLIVLLSFLFLTYFGVITFQFNFLNIGLALRQIAGPFFAERITSAQILDNYKTSKVKILIVPGHDNDSFGTQFNGTTEAQMNAELGQELFEFLQNDDKFETYITRAKNGDYSQWFSDYFESNKKEILKFREESKTQMRQAIKQGMPVNVQVEHNSVENNTSLRLYAINKWTNENGIEIVFHIHFNDYPGRNLDQPGKYSGFSIYIPEYQLPNHLASSELAKSLKNQLEKYFAKSDLPVESSILIEDQELIAIGSNASRDGISILTEYGYIYEPQFTKKEVRTIVLKEMAYQTYIGIKKFFDKNSSFINTRETNLLPYTWNKTLKKGMEGSEDVIRLQMALLKEGLYPPNSKTLEECPLSGAFKGCTFESIKKFQEKYAKEILSENGKTEKTNGYAGPKTLAKLNEIYGK